ncbi:radical SAM protein [Patescibacteria group bacterium]
MNKSNKQFKNSDFIFLFAGQQGHYALFNSLTCQVFYGKENLSLLYAHFSDWNSLQGIKGNRKISKGIIQKLIDEKFLISTSDVDLGEMSVMQEKARRKRGIKTLYLSLTHRCNFRCEYCLDRKSIAVGRKKDLDMSVETARLAADYYLKSVQPEIDKEVVFYGGEPLLNYRTLVFLTNYIQTQESKKQRVNPGYKKSRFILCTNGSLIDSKVALFLKENDIYPAVTLDGEAETHNTVRRSQGNHGTHNKVRENIEKLHQQGCPVGVSLTLGKHNISKLPQILGFFAEEVKPQTVATNVLVNYEGAENNQYCCDPGELAKGLVGAYKTARERGIYLVKYVMDNRIKPFVERTPRINGCTGIGSRIMVLPDGSVTICAAFAQRASVKLQDNPSLADFIPDGISNYSPFLRKECRGCYAISCCGGGCPRSAEDKHGTIFAQDDDYCFQSRYILRWLIWDLFEFVDRKKIRTQGYVIPSMSDRRKVYGEIKVRRTPLDFQYTPNAK